ncbi:MAG TPA: 2-oxoacid:acceptor oxidoreductase family protein [Chloroflexota bacterium]|nr:2-oxoacid:acceptor oxidoreductase family protein [Chloroflexota bacterium]
MERAVVMTGIGGQGVQLLARVLAQAAIREGKQAMTFGVFMGMIRGGASESTVVVADGEITTPPIVPHAWAILALHGEGLPKLRAKIEPGGVVVANADLVGALPAWEGVRTVAVAATGEAKALGHPLGAGMVALGAFVATTALVAPASLDAALADVLPPHRRTLADANRRCLARGAALVAPAASALRPFAPAC